jgi:hypothetical protein
LEAQGKHKNHHFPYSSSFFFFFLQEKQLTSWHQLSGKWVGSGSIISFPQSILLFSQAASSFAFFGIGNFVFPFEGC